MQISEPAEYAILGLLKICPMHGYEMYQQFESGIPGQIVHLEMSQMYAFLKKLERMEYIEAQLELRGARPPRKIYHLTTTGHEAFQQWLTEPVDKPRDIRILFLIKLYFVQRFAPDQVSQLIDRQLLACERFLVHLESQHHSAVATYDATFFDQVVLSSRIHQTRALLEWMRTLQKELV